MSLKTNRLNAITNLIASKRIHTQEEMMKSLNELGIQVTQATLSRDMKELGAIKKSDPGEGMYYALDSGGIATRAAHNYVDNIAISGQICVLHCRPGFAGAAAALLDSTDIDGVMGSIAGDDTVMVMLEKDADTDAIRLLLNHLFDISEIIVRTATQSDMAYADEICKEIFISSQERRTGIARRSPEYICEKILDGKAVIAVTEHGEFAGFSYIESWGGKSFVANSGLIVAHKFRGKGIARRIKEQTFKLSRKLFPDAKIFSITTGAAVMKMNYEFGFRPVPFSELTTDPEFWKGCQGCRHFDILKSHDYKMCICTGLLYDPNDNLTIHHPYDL